MTRRYFDNTPAILKPSTRYASRRELYFDRLDSSFIVGTAGSDSIGRGETITQAHLSELAFWPTIHARENFNGLMQAIPDARDRCVHREHRQRRHRPVLRDMAGGYPGRERVHPGLHPVVHRPRVSPTRASDFERTPDEIELAEKFALDNDQLMFRRRKIGENGLDLFRRSTPAPLTRRS
jgi:hypothetical protein